MNNLLVTILLDDKFDLVAFIRGKAANDRKSPIQFEQIKNQNQNKQKKDNQHTHTRTHTHNSCEYSIRILWNLIKF